MMSHYDTAAAVFAKLPACLSEQLQSVQNRRAITSVYEDATQHTRNLNITITWTSKDIQGQNGTWSRAARKELAIKCTKLRKWFQYERLRLISKEEVELCLFV